MIIAITGSSGLVGTALVAELQARGDEVIRLVRGEPRGPLEARWSPESGILDLDLLEGVDAVIHLAGENIAARRWSDAQKDRIRDSRIGGTQALVRSLLQLERGPRTFLTASAIGFYGASGSETVDETSGVGMGFLPEVCKGWEDAAGAIAESGARVAYLRFGVILSPEGGALAKMLLPFRLGVGGKVGTGLQGMSWVSLRDAVRAAMFALDTDRIAGPVNVVAPGACTNEEFTKALGRVLRRPTVLPMPGFAARLAFGELADDLLLASNWVQPRVLTESGFRFEDPEIDAALAGLLGRAAA